MRKFKNRILPRGVQIRDGKVWVRFFPRNGKEFKRLIGPVSQPEMIDTAITVLNDYRELSRCEKFGLQPKLKRIKLSEATQIYMERHGSKKARNGSEDRNILKRMITFYGDRFIDEFDFSDIERMRTWVGNLGLSVATVNRYHATLSCLFSILIRATKRREIEPIKLPEDNPCRWVKKQSELNRIRNRILTFDEYHRYIETAQAEKQPEAARIFNGALMTMLRLGDLMKLTKNNISAVSNSLKGIQSKTGKPFSIYIFDKIQGLIDTAPPGDRIFNFTNFRTIWERLRVKAGLGKDFQFRDLRRSGATWLYKKGSTMKSISHYLGHQSEQMTRRYIGILNEDEMIAGEYMKSIFNTPKNSKLTESGIIPKGEKPSIDVSNLEIPWLPEKKPQ